MIARFRPRLRLLALSGALALSAAFVGGCGESAPPEQPKTETPAPAPTAPAKTAKGKAGGKVSDPTVDMDRDQLREYKKKLKEQGKSL